MAESPISKSSFSLGKVKVRYIVSVHNKKYDKAYALAMSRFNQFNALIIAIANNAEYLGERLLACGWDVNEIRRDDGASAVHVAVKLRNFSMLKLLIKNGAKVSVSDNYGKTPLMGSFKTKQDYMGRNITQLLIENMDPEDFRGVDGYGDSLLHVMSRNESIHFRLFQLVMYKGVDVNSKDEFVGRSFFSEMIMHHEDEIFIIGIGRLAIRYGFDMMAIDRFGNTILHRICVEQKMNVLNWLISQQLVHIRVKNDSDQTPMFWAVKRGNMAIIRVLYGIGESFEGEACEMPGREKKSLSQIAYCHKHYHVAHMINMELRGEMVDGKVLVKSLFKLTKDTLRDHLASGGTDISRKVFKLGLPRALGNSLISLDWE